MNKSAVLKNQSILDIAVRDTGNADNAPDITLAGGLSITDTELPRELEIPASVKVIARNVEYYRGRNIRPATAITPEDTAVAPFGGIEFMGIEIDFVVS